MSEIGSRDLRNETASLIRRAQSGEDITVTVHGKPAAILTAYKQSRGQWIHRDEVAARLRRCHSATSSSAGPQELASSTDTVAPSGILHTSVFTAPAEGLALDLAPLPDRLATTVVTVAELNSAVLLADPMDLRAQRMAALDAVADMLTLPADHNAAHEWGRLRARLDHAGLQMRGNDVWIAAIAMSHGLPVVASSDAFDTLYDIYGLSVIRVDA